jgi:predicted DNA-binding mobile mystery protein A
MKNSKQALLIEQVDRKLKSFRALNKVIVPKKGWIYTVRTALKMSLRQLGEKMKITPQSVSEIEQREANESITLKSLRETAQALDMQLVYGFIPKEGSLEKMIEKRATEIALKIVMRTSNTMKLEDQENSKKRLEKNIKSKAREIIDTMPKHLWD